MSGELYVDVGYWVPGYADGDLEQYYLSLITSEHRVRPHFAEVVKALTDPLIAVQGVVGRLQVLYDLDTSVGVQLDAVGRWVGVSRNLSIPIPGVYFSWDDADADGWDSGTWQGPNDPTAGLVSLPDEYYRTLLRARIAANHWNGSLPDAGRVFDSVLGPTLSVVIVDNQDMSISIAIVGTGLTAVQQALVTGGYLPLKAEGVRIAEYFLPSTGGRMFAWDSDGPALGGWDEAAWGIEVMA